MRFAKLLPLLVLAACRSAPAPEPVRPAPPAVEPPAPTPMTSKAETQPVHTVAQTAAPQDLQFPEEAFRATQPAAGEQRPFRLPAVKPFTLKSGIKVYLVEQHTLPLVSMDLTFDGGSASDPKGKEGLASVCMAMLTEGTARLDKIQFAEALADVASSVGAYASDDTQGITLGSLSKHLDTTFALFVETLRSPGFRATDFDRMIKRRIEGVRQSKGNPASVASRVAAPVLYGTAHPFGTVTTEASLKAITLEDCKTYAATWLEPARAKLFVVGDLTEAQVRAYFDGEALASWKGAPPKPARLPTPKGPAGRIFFVHMPGAAQSQVSALHFGPKRNAPDYFATSMMGAVFGGGFSSRINMNLREDKGYSYGARGGFNYTRNYGTFNANASVRTDSTYQTLLEIDREVKELWSGARPIQKDELAREKEGAILGLPGRFQTAQAALGQYRNLVYYGLPLDYYNKYVAGLAKITEAAVKTAAAKHLKPGQAVYLVVGDGDAKVVVRKGKEDVPYEKDGKQLTLREALADLAARGDVGQGGLVELDTDGNPIK
ncbi:MAG TPA: pitrilysin family protein [Kofleriaceae bacterium]|jgi:predicted Zn-dependent peptidase|nr:pitrilysin family protein [Kofleriaceae bacterium]